MVVKPLTSLTGKAEWNWTLEAQEAYEELKECLCNPPVLTIPDNKGPFTSGKFDTPLFLP